MLADLDAEFEPKPVRLTFERRCIRVPARARNDPIGVRFRNLHLPSKRAQLGQRVGDERAVRLSVPLGVDRVVRIAIGWRGIVVEQRELDRAEALEYDARLRLSRSIAQSRCDLAARTLRG